MTSPSRRNRDLSLLRREFLRRSLGLSGATLLGTVSISGLPGCSSPLGGLIEEINQLIITLQRSLTKLRGDVALFPARIEELLDSVDEKVRALLEDGTIGRVVELIAVGTFEEVKTLLVMLQDRLIAYVGALLAALIEVRDRIASDRGIRADTLETIVAGVIARLQAPDPFVGHLVPTTLECRQNGTLRMLVQTQLTASGFGLGGREAQIELIGVDRSGQRVWTAPPGRLDINHSFRATYTHPEQEGIPSTVESLWLVWTPPGRLPVKLAAFTLKPVAPESPKLVLSRVEVEFIGSEKLPSRALDAVVGGFTASHRLVLATPSAVGAGDYWAKGKTYGTGPIAVDMAIDEVGMYYVDLSMSAGEGGAIQHVYEPYHGGTGSFGTYYSRTHTPRYATTRQLEPMGFLRERSDYVLRDPVRLVADNWRGRVYLTLHFSDGRVLRMDESPQVEFKRGKAGDDSYTARIQWDRNGRELN